MDTAYFDTLTAAQLEAAGSRKWTAFPGCIGAFIAEMDFGLAPPIRQALDKAMADGLTGYLTGALLQDLGDACAQWQQTHHGWAIHPADVNVMPDVLSALEVVLRYFLPAGTPVIVPVPCYMPFIPILNWVDNPVIQLPMLRTADGWQMDEAGLDAAFAGGAGLLLLCNPHNPIGKVYTREELARISAIVARHGARVFSDEIHAPLIFEGQQHVPYAAISEAAADQAITAVSASKMWNLAGLKCAQVVLTNEQDRALWRRIGHRVNDATSTFGVIAHTAAWAQGEPWRQQVLAGCDLFTNTAIYMFPRYVVSYALSIVCAQQLKAAYDADPVDGWARYHALCASGGSKLYAETLAAAGLELPYAPGVVERMARELAAQA